MRVDREGIYSRRLCAYQPKQGELTPESDGRAGCPMCKKRLLVTAAGALRPHADYRRLKDGRLA